MITRRVNSVTGISTAREVLQVFLCDVQRTVIEGAKRNKATFQRRASEPPGEPGILLDVMAENLLKISECQAY
ncbi:hypothetical protein R1flu_027714 [Riccia fluitans]|uniref:Uncharacterized protein n=1 Tax=Riccia fluitans TaxID=41844 RepID=A0ABD1XJP7_9MARC